MQAHNEKNVFMLNQLVPLDDFYFSFANFVKSIECRLPAYTHHRHAGWMDELVIKFGNAENEFSHCEMHDPQFHSFQTNYDIRSPLITPYAYFLIAAEYYKKTCFDLLIQSVDENKYRWILAMILKVFSIENLVVASPLQFPLTYEETLQHIFNHVRNIENKIEIPVEFELFKKQVKHGIATLTVINAFDPEIVRPGQRIFLAIGPFLPIRLRELIQHVCPRIVALQARRYLRNYFPDPEPEEKIKLVTSAPALFSSLSRTLSVNINLGKKNLPPLHPGVPQGKQIKDQQSASMPSIKYVKIQ